MSKIYAGDFNNNAKKPKTLYIGYNNKAIMLHSKTNIYGVVWDGSATTSWRRIKDSKNFTDPHPYYDGMSGTPSSPFDNIVPWAGMVKSEHPMAGTVVAIPKFYYKMEYASGTTGLKIQIAPASNGSLWAADNGFKCSPAHMDRGDGYGERNFVYVGRYHCASDYKSKTGVSPTTNKNLATFRTNIHNLGSTIWQWDYATLVTIWMLYLVEFADWNSQAKIGGGCSVSGSRMSVGYTDVMPYHTGTTAQSIGAGIYGGTQYRNIEGLWDNVYDWIDGIARELGTTTVTGNLLAQLNPNNFANKGTVVGTFPKSRGYISSFKISNVSGYEWCLSPYAISGSDSTYITDKCDSYSNPTLSVGGSYNQSQDNGLFYYNAGYNASTKVGCRLMVLP